MINVGIVGATGYTGGELLQYLLRHPQARVLHCTSESSAGKSVFSFHPSLSGLRGSKALADGAEILKRCDPERISKDVDLVFLCLPHAASAAMGKKFLDRKVKVVDLSADFRLKSEAVYEKWYKVKHPCPELLKEAVYGLPEINRKKIAKARLIANPGCYATATALSFLPLVSAKLTETSGLIADAASGVSGAGRKLENKYLFCEANENYSAYAVDKHRHCPEIEQTLSIAGGSPVTLTFVPHLLPVERGILVTGYAELKRAMTSEELRALYAKFYKGERFVTVLPEGEFPDLRSVNRSNGFQVGVKADARHKRAIIVGAIDNLGKGAASQAVQNMNLMFRLDEHCGLA